MKLTKRHSLVLQYKDDKGTHLLRWMEKYVRKILPKKSGKLSF